MPKQNIKLTERSQFSSPHQVDRESGVIRSVRILGSVSRNGRRYLPEAMAGAAKCYEGCQVFCDHAQGTGDSERSLRDLVGNLRNIKHENNEVRGDLHYLKTHPLAETIAEAAESFSGCLGLSHVALATGESVNGEWVCDEVRQVLSVDLVTRPATNSSLFESVKVQAMPDPVQKTTYRKLLESSDKGKKLLAGIIKEMGPMADPMLGAEMGVDAAPASTDDQIADAFGKAVAAIMADKTMSPADRRAKVIAILDSMDGIAGSTSEGDDKGGGGGGDPPKEEKPSEESVKLRAEKAILENHLIALKLLTKAGINPTEEQLEAVAAQTDTSKRAKLIESWKPQHTGNGGGNSGNAGGYQWPDKPATSPPLRESQGVTAYPSDVKGFVKQLKV